MSIRGIQSANTYQPSPELRPQRPEKSAEDNRLKEKPAEPASREEFMPRDEYIPSRRAAAMRPKPAPEKEEPEICTIDITKVNREVKRLKDERTELEQQVRAESSPEKAEELNRKLARVESELLQKDNDMYRR